MSDHLTQRGARVVAAAGNRAGILLSIALILVVWAGPTSAQPPERREPISKEHADFFESKIRPLLIEHCYGCHSQESGESEGELLLDSADGLRQGGVRGTTIVPGQPDKSLLLKVIQYDDAELQMPPDGKLDRADIEAIKQWIAIGAPDPRSDSGKEQSAAPSPLDRDPKTHWAFNVPKRARVDFGVDGRSRDLIDAFAHHRASAKGLKPSVEAAKEELVRRLYFDLTGLPPSKKEIERFVGSEDPAAYTRLVDRLLATPDFGQRFGRHWMDVSRYADTLGYATAGKTRRHTGSERFRDWVIDAFASDMPYDQMLHHQLAGDRTDPENVNGNLDAMGFLTLGRKFLNPLDTIDDRIDVISRGLLGMTVACARCHDHKFDPIPMADYYSLGGIIFSSTQPQEGASPLMLVDKDRPIDSPILIRGQISNRGPIAPRQFLTALRQPNEPRFSDGSGRWELAQRITDSDNPLTARVMVNRLWGHLIGKPLVDSPSDFGFRTQAAVIPEILDDLSAEFSEHWSIKKTVRRIVLSRIYRQSSDVTSSALQADPDNALLARANRRRRDFESLRDSILSVSGAIDHSIGGEPVEITLDTPSPRRTVYAMIDRQNLPAVFRTFDFASPDTHAPLRYFTTVPQQALHLLNNKQMFDLANRTAEAIRRDARSDEPDVLVTETFRRVLGRDPTAAQRRMAAEFLRQPASPPPRSLDARSLWSYGTATIDEKNGPTDFKPLGVFQKSRWQPDSKFPSPGAMGHAYLGKETGHTASERSIAVVRRFTAPFSGQVRLIGTMGHRSDKGDGFVAAFWVAGRRLFQEVQKSNDRPYGPLSDRIEKGQTVDFVATAGQSSSFDTFYWNVRVKIVGDDGRILETDSTKHFSGPFDAQTVQPLDRLAQLAQTLLMSNEFAFVD